MKNFNSFPSGGSQEGTNNQGGWDSLRNFSRSNTSFDKKYEFGEANEVDQEMRNNPESFRGYKQDRVQKNLETLRDRPLEQFLYTKVLSDLKDSNLGMVGLSFVGDNQYMFNPSEWRNSENSYAPTIRLSSEPDQLRNFLMALGSAHQYCDGNLKYEMDRFTEQKYRAVPGAVEKYNRKMTEEEAEKRTTGEKTSIEKFADYYMNKYSGLIKECEKALSTSVDPSSLMRDLIRDYEMNPETGQSAATGEKAGMETLKPSNENKAEKMEKPASAADETVDRILDKVGRGKGEGYFRQAGTVFDMTEDALETTTRKAKENFTTKINNYIDTKDSEHGQRALNLHNQTVRNVKELESRGLVGDDTIRVFLNSDLISLYGGLALPKYGEIQTDFSRRDGKNLMPIDQTAARYHMRAKEMADNFAKISSDIKYQNELKYDPNKPFADDTFVHVNANSPKSKTELRCYISADKTGDPAMVLDAWNKSLSNSPLKNTLYFKFFTSINDGDKQRPDDIIIYKGDNIDDGEFKTLLQDFQKRCNQISPELLPDDKRKLPPATQKIANGISIAGEPSYVNDYLRYTGNKDGRHSWTTFVDKMLMLSTSLAMHRLGIKADSIEAPGLEEETKKVFREFMLLSKINPDTMLPVECGDQLPAWAKLGG